MSDLIVKSAQTLVPKTYRGHRVVTLREIDEVHGRRPGTANGNFQYHKKRFTKDVDYFVVTEKEVNANFPLGSVSISPKYRTAIVLSKTGYLMLAKTLSDNQAWSIQRQLVDSYFNSRIIEANPQLVNEPRECQDCHRENAPDAIYCDKCGVRLMTDGEIIAEDLRSLISSYYVFLPETQRDKFRDTILMASDYIAG